MIIFNNNFSFVFRISPVISVLYVGDYDVIFCDIFVIKIIYSSLVVISQYIKNLCSNLVISIINYWLC